MEELFYCIRIMQISTDKLQSNCHSESLRRSSLIRSTFLQSRKQFADLIHSLIKISSDSNEILPVFLPEIDEENRMKFLAAFPLNSKSVKRKLCPNENVKRMRLAPPSTTTSMTMTNLSHVELIIDEEKEQQSMKS